MASVAAFKTSHAAAWALLAALLDSVRVRTVGEREKGISCRWVKVVPIAIRFSLCGSTSERAS